MKTIAKILLTSLFLLSTLPLRAMEPLGEGGQAKLAVVAVSGQVVTPGIIEYKKRMTIFAVITEVGGATKFGSLKNVKVYRGGKQILLDLTDEKMKTDEFAEQGDIIEVAQKNWLGQ